MHSTPSTHSLFLSFSSTLSNCAVVCYLVVVVCLYFGFNDTHTDIRITIECIFNNKLKGLAFIGEDGWNYAIQTHVTARSVSKLGATVEISGFKQNNNEDIVETDAKNHGVSIHFCHSSTLIVLCLCCLILIVVVYSRHCRRQCCCCCHWFWLATFSTTTILFIFRALDLNKSKHVPRTTSTRIATEILHKHACFTFTLSRTVILYQCQ